MVIQLWDDTPDAEDAEDWGSGEALEPMPDRSIARLVSMVLMASALVAMVTAVSYILGSGASPHEELITSADELATELDTFDATTVSPDFGGIDRAARRVLATAQELEVGDAGRAIAIDAAGRILDAERSLSEAIAYRTGFIAFIGRPALPTSTDELDDVTSEYTSWLSSVSGVLEPVPDHGAFDAHRDLVARFSERSPRLQARYLDALRANDASAAAQALSDLDGLMTRLDTSLTDAMAESHQAFEDATGEGLTILGGLQYQP